jgi:membrane-bound inhibitor of C-type lysozyme
MRAWLGLAVLALSATPAFAAPEMISATYVCERGVEIAVTYVNSADGSVAVLQVEGRQAALPQAEAASGARYGAMGNVSGYFWWTKGDTGTLSWFSAEHSEEVTLYMECKEAAK